MGATEVNSDERLTIFTWRSIQIVACVREDLIFLINVSL